MKGRFGRGFLLACALGCGSSGVPGGPDGGFTLTLGSTETFATHSQFAALGFLWGPPDGTMGAIVDAGTYTFFGSAKGSSACSASPKLQGAFRVVGSLEQLTGLPHQGCQALFDAGAAPAGWVFDQDYAGGGPVVPFVSGTTHGFLMTYHGEIHWTNPTGNGLCSNVPCFYGGIGLAVSLDQGASFHSVGQIIQAYQPLSAYNGGGRNAAIGYGAMVVADAAGHPLAAPLPNPSSAYLYVFYEDSDPNGLNACANTTCVTVARAPFDNVVEAAMPPSSPATVAGLFAKYDSTAANVWSQPGTSGDPTENTASGHFTPLFDDQNSVLPTVLWDGVAQAYLLVAQVYQAGPPPAVFSVRSSTDLLHWSAPLGTFAPPSGHVLFYPSLIGETGDPLVGAGAPRLFFSTFVTFPDWTQSELDSLPVQISPGG
ncbi:MAG: hypothetical protein ACLQDQ_14535 [Myxococcaceae bacterium]